MSEIVTVKKFKYVLDWFDISDVEINLDDFYCFEIQNRLGNWYLLHFVLKENKRVNVFEHDFQLSEPWVAAAKLGEKIAGFDNLHGINKKFTTDLSVLLDRAWRYKRGEYE